jgi:hypothetical protein
LRSCAIVFDEKYAHVQSPAPALELASSGRLPIRHRACGERPFELIRNANMEWLTNPDSDMQALNDMASPICRPLRFTCGLWATMRNHAAALEMLADERFSPTSGLSRDGASVNEIGKRKVDAVCPVRGRKEAYAGRGAPFGIFRPSR